MKNVRDSYTTIRSNKIDRGRSKIKDTERRNGLLLEEKRDLIHLPTRIVEKKVLRTRLILSSSSFPRAILHRNLDPPCQRGKVEHPVLDLFTSYSLCRENERFFLIISRILAKSYSRKVENSFKKTKITLSNNITRILSYRLKSVILIIAF